MMVVACLLFKYFMYVWIAVFISLSYAVTKGVREFGVLVIVGLIIWSALIYIGAFNEI